MQNRGVKKRSWPWFRLVFLIVILGGGFWWWKAYNSSNSDKQKRPQAPVVLAPAVRRDVPIYLTGLGTVQAYNTVTVHSQIDGQLMEVKFHEGQNVKAGDVLAQIDPRTFKAAWEQAKATKQKDEATLANAQADLERYKKLDDAVAKQTLDTQAATVRQLTAQVQADAAAIDSAATQLSYTTITAPITGRLGIRQVDAGNIVHPGDANGLVVITQLQPVATVFSLPQQNLAAINEQLGASNKHLDIDALATDNTTVIDHGSLLLIDNQIDVTTGTIKLKAAFPNKQFQLWPGAFVTARMLLNTLPQALTIPTVAVQQGPQGAYVFLFNAEDTTVHMQPITVSMTEGLDSIITDGLKEGDQVVVDGMAKLQDKSKVTLGGDKAKDKDNADAGPAKSDDAADKNAPPPTADAAAQKEKAPDDASSSKHHHKHSD